MVNVFLLLGSNLGNRQLFITQAIKYIEQNIAPVVKASAVYETEAWGSGGQPNYLNQVILVETAFSARDVLDKILTIELLLGRRRYIKWGSRTIDIDILFYGDEIISQPGLEVPHRRLHERRFTMEPLTEIAPEMTHPLLKRSILQLKNELNDNLIVKKL